MFFFVLMKTLKITLKVIDIALENEYSVILVDILYPAGTIYL